MKHARHQLVLAVASTLIVVGSGVVLAQSSVRGIPGGQMKSPAPAGKAGQARKNQRVIDWFTKYDEIRHEAQMTRQEREQSQSMMKAIMKMNASEAKAGSVLLGKMAQRYKRAVDQLNALPTIAETAQLQRGYLQYFNTGQKFFSKFHQMATNFKGIGDIGQLEQARNQMKDLHLSNKSLDKKLRKKFDIEPYRFD